VITPEQRVKCWGRGNVGQLGDGLRGSHGKATTIEGVEGAELLAVAGTHVCAITRGGKLVCWGDVLGLGTPKKATTVPMPKSARYIAAEDSTTLAILADGTAWYWGHMMGLPTGPPNIVAEPMRLPSFDGASQVTHPPGGTLLRDGAVRCPDPSSNPCVSSVPGFGTPVVRKIASTLFYQWALRADGTLWQASLTTALTWSVTRIEGVGRVRDFGAGDARVCLVEDSGEVFCFAPETPKPVRVTGLPAVDQLAAGSTHHCALSRVSEEVWCWGTNDFGELGDGTTTARVGPVRAL